MSWENDKGIIIFMLIMSLVTLFCIFMAVFSSRKSQRMLKTGLISKKEIIEKKQKKAVKMGYIFQVSIGLAWLLSGILIYVLYNNKAIGNTFTIPRFMSFFYDFLGISIASIIQVILSLSLMIDGIKKLRN